ncbi:kinase domain containing [Fusarium albosuccineum]|uniref:Kinase domain containing n=1 Tax=Fusarium albosuccineum TaxID=1237068 RepID=A0A8H4LFQ3_9HYPO|nr:kinase domain containing [Fusarium albosuccineum]
MDTASQHSSSIASAISGVVTFSLLQHSTDRLFSEEQRFRLWAHSLGLHQKGHASLDYRLRDATAVRRLLIEILVELKSHLGNLHEVWSGKRPPFEVEEPAADKTDDSDESGSLASSRSCFHEVEFRVQSVGENLDALYSVAAKIRSPRYRPQRPTEQLYKNVSAAIRDEYRQQREETEIAIVAYIQRQQLLEALKQGSESPLVDADEVVDSYASSNQWLIRRTGMANARRKQQLVYWKEHADRIKGPVEDAPLVAEKLPQQIPVPATVQPAVDPSQHLLSQSRSLATSATRLDGTFVKLDDLRSVISHESRPSTVVNLRGEKLEWPPPPKQTHSTSFFVCPYCKVLCPHRYLSQDAWRIHLIHDLQPYHCTYPDCHDPNRTYGTRQEWLDHENLHLRVWHCQLHGLEFETQSEYVSHVQQAHLDVSMDELSPELIASVVGPSLRPHRDCPFCPTAFASIEEMQKHMAFHLERLALYVLPSLDDTNGEGQVSGHSSDTNNAERRGRGNSIPQDFGDDWLNLFEDPFLSRLDTGNGEWSSLERLQSEMGYKHAIEPIKTWIKQVKDAQSGFSESTSPQLLDDETQRGIGSHRIPQYQVGDDKIIIPNLPKQALWSSPSQEMLGELYKKNIKSLSEGVVNQTLAEPSSSQAPPAPTEKNFPYLFHLNGRANFAWRDNGVLAHEGEKVLMDEPANSTITGKRGLQGRLQDSVGQRSELL